MKIIFATIIKEWILLKRDVAGFMLLYIMPAILIVVMALVQDAPFKDYQEIRFDLLLVDNDRGSLSAEIKRGLQESKNFHIIDKLNGNEISDSQLRKLLMDGEYRAGIIIPKGATAEVVNAANIVANNISKKLGLGQLPAREMRDSTYVRMYFDPATKPTFRLSISNALDKFITYSCSNMLLDRMSALGSIDADTSRSGDFKKIFQGIGLKEESLNKKSDVQSINSVQHNVPAWAIFGMFFIVIPIVSHVIRERDEGSALRVQLVPNANGMVGMGKIIFNTMVCTMQFICMLCIGIWILPFIGLPALYLGEHPAAILPVAIAIAYAATSFGYFTAAIFKTTNQALPFASISIVILSAMGGIWVPVELLPGMMQKIALASPLHWGLDGIHQVMLRQGNFKDIIPHLSILLAFGTLMWFISIMLNRRREFSF